MAHILTIWHKFLFLFKVMKKVERYQNFKLIGPMKNKIVVITVTDRSYSDSTFTATIANSHHITLLTLK